MLKRRLTREELYQKIGTNSIFNHYFGNFTCYSKSYKSVFRKDDKASTGFFIGEGGEVVYSDLRTGEKWGAVQFVMALYGLSYQEAIEKIAADFGLIKSNTTHTAVAKIIKHKEIKKTDKIIEITTKGWNLDNIKFWDDYEISKEELTKGTNKVYPVSYLYINGYEVPNPSKLDRFAILIPDQGKEYLKIYSPFDSKKEFKWVSNSPLKIPFGYQDLTYDSDTLIVSKSLKDMLILRKLFKNVIALQNESKGSYNPELLDPILSKFKKVIFWFDCDRAGIESLEYFKGLGYDTFSFPEKFLREFNIKDPADFSKKWGVNYLHKFLETNELFRGQLLGRS